MARRPNILFVMVDQLAPQVLSAYGGKRVKTPHIDHLAAEGVVFENAYCNFPLCAPARFSMLSGQLPSRIGAYDNAIEFPASVPTFQHYLRLAGYRTCLAGKMHFVGPDQLHGYEERVTTDVYPADFLWTPDWRLDPEHWLEWYHSMRAVLDAGTHRKSVNIAYDDEVEFEAIRWLHEYADQGDDRPFALTVSFFSPHDPYLAPPAWLARCRFSGVDRPNVPDIPLDERDPHSRRHWFLTGRHLDPITETDVLRMRLAYSAITSYVDAKIGRILDTLQQIDVAGNTVIVFTSDHGDSLGERGLFFKMSFFEWSVRVPLVLHAPFAFGPRRVRENVSHLDLFPTLLELAGEKTSRTSTCSRPCSNWRALKTRRCCSISNWTRTRPGTLRATPTRRMFRRVSKPLRPQPGTYRRSTGRCDRHRRHGALSGAPLQPAFTAPGTISQCGMPRRPITVK